MILDVSVEDFEEEVLKASVAGPVLVDFNAEWCGPCQALHPILEEVAGELAGGADGSDAGAGSGAGGARIVAVNIDENPELAERFSVAAIPCLVLFRDGEEVDRNVGLMSKKKILKMMGVK